MAKNDVPERIWIGGEQHQLISANLRGGGNYYHERASYRSHTDIPYVREHTQPAEDKRVKEAARCIIATVLGFNSLDNLASLPPEHANRRHVEAIVIDAIRGLLPVQPAQTVDLSLLPYEIAEELPKIGGEFGKIAAMCKSHVAAFIEKLINARTVQPAASTLTPTDKQLENLLEKSREPDAWRTGSVFHRAATPAVIERLLLERKEVDSILRFALPNNPTTPLLEVARKILTFMDNHRDAAASTEAQNERDRIVQAIRDRADEWAKDVSSVNFLHQNCAKGLADFVESLPSKSTPYSGNRDTYLEAGTNEP